MLIYIIKYRADLVNEYRSGTLAKLTGNGGSGVGRGSRPCAFYFRRELQYRQLCHLPPPHSQNELFTNQCTNRCNPSMSKAFGLYMNPVRIWIRTRRRPLRIKTRRRSLRRGLGDGAPIQAQLIGYGIERVSEQPERIGRTRTDQA